MNSLYYRVENPAQDLNTYLTTLKEACLEAPLLSWIDPKPGLTPGGEYDNNAKVTIMCQGWPSLAHPLEEVRLFWEQGSLHAVSTAKNRCQVFEFSEHADWKDRESVTPSTDRILLRRDWDRFGLDKPSSLKVKDEVTIIQYFRAGALFAWRIVP